METRGAVHVTAADTQPCAFQGGGHWLVACLCGWEDSGRYARDSGRRVAEKLARLKGIRHEQEATGR